MRFIDSHTEGEPTRVIVSGGPDLGGGTIRDRLERFRTRFDSVRRFAILEPRGCDAIVGALLCEPHDPTCTAGVIFFNNTGFLNMCGHGAIGVAVTLAYLGKIGLGSCRLETSVRIINANLLSSNSVSIDNIPSYCYRRGVSLTLDGVGEIQGDIAWGGNWFFLANQPYVPVVPKRLKDLSELAGKVRSSLKKQGITGENGSEIDHIEFFGPASNSEANSRNFVYCPGGAYDRSPCGTGTSAKLACLAASGDLAPGEIWIQESIIGSRFQASYRNAESGFILPNIQGKAFICSEGNLIQHSEDPFRFGISLGERA